MIHPLHTYSVIQCLSTDVFSVPANKEKTTRNIARRPPSSAIPNMKALESDALILGVIVLYIPQTVRLRRAH